MNTSPATKETSQSADGTAGAVFVPAECSAVTCMDSMCPLTHGHYWQAADGSMHRSREDAEHRSFFVAGKQS